jgi:hypothetical protein
MFTLAQAAAMPLSQIELLAPKALVEVHNLLAPAAKVPETKRFATRVDGIKRVNRLAEAVRAAAPKVVEAPAPIVAAPAKVNGHGSVAEVAKAAAKKATADATARIAAASKAKAVTEPSPAPVVGRPAKIKAPTVASRCRELFAAGKTNEETWAVVKSEFSMADSKKWHVAWHRADGKRKAAKVAS